jgi:hypothetical protein
MITNISRVRNSCYEDICEAIILLEHDTLAGGNEQYGTVPDDGGEWILVKK